MHSYTQTSTYIHTYIHIYTHQVLEIQLLCAALQGEEDEAFAEWQALIALESDIHVRVNECQTQLLDTLCSFQGSILDSTADLGELVRLKDEIQMAGKRKDELKKRRSKVLYACISVDICV
jgi:hypothetical protein